MKFENFLLQEAYLMSEYTFGFELEGFDKEKRAFNVIEKIINNYFDIQGEVKIDTSLVPSDKKTERPFEYASGKLNFTPKNIQSLLNLLTNLDKEGLVTNKSCGFHIHIGFPYISEQDMVWLTLNLSINKDMLDSILKFKKYEFYNVKFASIRFLENIKKAFLDSDFLEVRKYLTSDKYRVLRLHPQGTLEWRGPREFLDQHNVEDIKDFVSLLYRFVKWIDTTLDSNVLNVEGRKPIKKNDILSILSFKKGEIIEKSGRFDFDQDPTVIPLVIKNIPWVMKAELKRAKLKISENGKLIFEKGNWIGGIWEEGIWKNGYWEEGIWKNGYWENGVWGNGTWENGTWANGTWEFGDWKNGTWKSGDWEDGAWYNGKWEIGIWKDGYWSNGTWMTGVWKNGLWEKGTWFHGEWKGGQWVNGIWNSGNFNKGIWSNGKWKSGDFTNSKWESGTWIDGIFNKSTWLKGTWNNGIWKESTFISGVWKNGKWESGTWLGGKWQGGKWLIGRIKINDSLFVKTINITPKQVKEAIKNSINNNEIKDILKKKFGDKIVGFEALSK
jgi:hypothetical protein